MQFLKRLLGKSSDSKDSAIEEPTDDTVNGTEPIARFILDRKGKHSATKNIVKANAFLPDGHNETSVYRIPELSESEIWSLGESEVAQPSGRIIYARGDVLAQIVEEVGLKVDPAPNPHPRHANIIGWPTEKDKQKSLAQEIAAAATLRLPT